MSKLLSAVMLFLMFSPLFAATKEMEEAAAAGGTVDMIWVIVFGVIFIGAILGFVIYLFMSDKGKNAE